LFVFNSCPDHTHIILEGDERDIIQSLLEAYAFGADGAVDSQQLSHHVADETGATPLQAIAVSAALADQLMYALCIPEYNNEEESEPTPSTTAGNITTIN